MSRIKTSALRIQLGWKEISVGKTGIGQIDFVKLVVSSIYSTARWNTAAI